MIFIIGAGIAGLSLARELLELGADVTIADAGSIAGAASGVATSYLEPRLGHTPIRAVERASHTQWPSYVALLEEQTGHDVFFRNYGQVRICLDDTIEKFNKDLAQRDAEGWTVERLSKAQLHTMAPALSDEIASAAFVPHISWVNGREVCHALAKRIRALGGDIHENHPIVRLEGEEGNFRLTGADGKIWAAHQVVFCTGLGRLALEGKPADIREARAVRGVNLVLDQSILPVPFTHLVKHHRGNFCPRDGGELIVGTTYEPGEENLTPDEAVIEKLYANAEDVLPAIRSLPLKRVTAGLRSKIGDGNLNIGQSKEQSGVFFSLSHAGAGYLRAPLVSAELAKLIVTGEHGTMTGFLTNPA